MNDKPSDSSDSKVRILQPEQYLRLRKIMHELSNVVTGLLISAGLMAEASHPIISAATARRYRKRPAHRSAGPGSPKAATPSERWLLVKL